MTERDAYLSKMESEKREADAKIAEIQAHSDLEKTDEELDVLTGAKQRRENFDRKLAELRRADEQDFERLKAGMEKAKGELKISLEQAGKKMDTLDEAYTRKREAELRGLTAQVDQWEASMRRSKAESSLLTREEFTFMKRGIQNTWSLLKNLGKTKGAAWSEARREYESAWDDLCERSRRIRADSSTEDTTAQHP